jgi:hypothetical protein
MSGTDTFLANSSFVQRYTFGYTKLVNEDWSNLGIEPPTI